MAVPSGRLSRLARFGGLASGVAGGMLAEGARQFSQGKRPTVGDLLLTPANAVRVTEQLAQLRGAAMKVGQLISMDAGEMLPPELSDILSRLRADARPMPQVQLKAALNRRWGRGWEARFQRFDFDPVAAASIGQVHRALTREGEDLAVKVQYPGVRNSIDSDVDNVATLLRVSGLLPRELDVTPLLGEAKRQLHEEADYEREGQHLARFGALLADHPDVVVPALHAGLTRPDVLAMTYLSGDPVEDLIAAPQAQRDQVATVLMQLLLRELFEFGLMQTDPNFANYRHEATTGRIVLLDFGATREIRPEVAEGYRIFLKAALDDDRDGAIEAARRIGFFDDRALSKDRAGLEAMFDLAMAPFRAPGPFDFGDTAVVGQLRTRGMTFAEDRAVWHIPPIDTLFIQRKLGGIYLLAARLKARVDVRAILQPWL
ncbi:AarF/ABC1/UbiB kinase family protein [Brevundimonas sp. AJA228-03]|uniref:ABC1 kinase family protein n=1 Tax=Brevundimonas sp. AJA228-03 TaxID=2752515 RepID=UPI001FD81B22|nr:AarF/ABC1/UbiB kinase family protein [Brevundimonas sp. AJA228-03]